MNRYSMLPPELRSLLGHVMERQRRHAMTPEERAEKQKIKERRKAERDRKRDQRRKARR